MNACPKEKLTKDKQKLIGHASEEQLKYYQDVEICHHFSRMGWSDEVSAFPSA